jgi:hypothetical protein
MVIPKLRQHRALTQAIVSCETLIAGLKQDISAEFAHPNKRNRLSWQMKKERVLLISKVLDELFPDPKIPLKLTHSSYWLNAPMNGSISSHHFLQIRLFFALEL